MPRTYAKFGEWEKIGLKPKKESKISDASKKKAQIEKFSKCKVCGGQMTYLPFTNTLICENEVEKKMTLPCNEGEEPVVRIVKEKCGNINMVDKQYQGYMNYLFN